jgi:hypothetical protein
MFIEIHPHTSIPEKVKRSLHFKAQSHTPPILIKEVYPKIFETREHLKSFGTTVTATNNFCI